MGVSLSAAVLLCDFLGMCIAASVEMTGEPKLNGAGFVFLILEILFVGAATALVVCTLTRWSTKAETKDAATAGAAATKVGNTQTQAGSPPSSTPTLMSSPRNGAQKPTTSDPAPGENEKNAE